MVDRLQPPSLSTPSNIALTQPQTFPLTNGGNLYVFHNGSVETLRLEFILRHAGSKRDHIMGTNLLCSKLLLAGTQSYNSKEIHESLALNGAFIDVSAGFDHTILSVYCLKNKFDKLTRLIQEIIYQQVFPHKEIELQKQIINSQLKTQLEKSAIVASRLMRKSLFSNHPYANSLFPGDVNNISQVDLVRHFEEHFILHDVIITGCVDDSLVKKVQDSFSANQFVLSQTGAQLVSESESKHAPLNNSVQTSIRLGKLTIEKKHNDYIPLYITNHLLGGFFGSRLMSNIREDKGLTYGISSSIIHLQEASYLAIGCDVMAEKSDIAIEEILKELSRLSNEKVAMNEIELLSQQLIGSIQRELSSINAASDKFKGLYFHNMVLNYYQQLLENVKCITPDTIQGIARQYLHPESFSIITAGG